MLRDGSFNNNTIVTMNTISGALHKAFNHLRSSSSYETYIDAVEDLAKYLTLAVSIFGQLSPSSEEARVQEKEAKSSAFYLWDLAGRRHFKQGEFTKAVVAFEHAIAIAGGGPSTSCITLYWFSQALVASLTDSLVCLERNVMDEISRVEKAIKDVIDCDPRNVVFRSSKGRPSVQTEITSLLKDIKMKAQEQMGKLNKMRNQSERSEEHQLQHNLEE